MFVESFQGQYKDGTNGTRDLRMVSASFLVIRILIVGTFLNHNYYIWGSVYQSGLLASVSSLYAIIKPYKLNFMTNVDILILLLIEILLLVTNSPAPNHLTFAILVTTLLLGVPHTVLTFYICYELTKKAGINQCLKRKYDNLKNKCIQATGYQCVNQPETDIKTAPDTGFLPDRLINPHEYEPLLSTR